jgi:hypothetical protein
MRKPIAMISTLALSVAALTGCGATETIKDG